jgi:ATP-dependent RNA helicase RhlE
MLHRLSMSRSAQNKFGGTGIRVLVLTPTRELAAQVEESVRTYGKYLQLSSTVIFGGVGMNPQISKLKKGVDILVATPGRLLDLQQQGMLDLGQVQMLILDEADRMLDMGFIHDVKKVLALVPKDKQSLLFSATFSDEIRDLAANLLNDPLHIQVTPRNTTVQRITQVIHPVGRAKKKALLAHIITQNNWSQVLVFTRTKFGANNVAEFLEKNGITAMALHGNKSQSARTQALAGFKSGDVRALVATDIAARGIDIDDLPHVVNYEIPNVSEDYVHRIGRTGRAGADGQAVNFVCLDEEGFMKDIEAFTKQNINVEIVEGFGPDAGEKAEPLAMGRQTIWGGLGKPPGRDVMAAAAKAARTDMLNRVRENRAGNGAPNGRGPAGGGRSGNNGGNGSGHRTARPSQPGQGFAGADNGGRPPAQRPAQAGRGRPFGGGGGGFGSNQGNNAGNQGNFGNGGGDDFQPRNIRHDAGRNVTGFSSNNQGNNNQRGGNAGGQPDPLRTSVDSMAGSGRRGGGNNGGGGSGFGGNRGGNRSGGGGFAPRGPGGNPPRSFGR